LPWSRTVLRCRLSELLRGLFCFGDQRGDERSRQLALRYNEVVATFLGPAGTARRARSVKSKQTHRANRSLSASNQSGGMPKWTLKNCEQRPATQTPRNLEPDSADYQVETRNAELTGGNLGLSHTPGNLAAETALVG